MKLNKLLTLGCLVVLFLTTSSTTQDNTGTDLQGSWTLIKYKYGLEKELNDVPEIITYVKHITGSHFGWASYGEGGNVIAAGGGTYEINGTLYSEHIEYFHPLGSSLPGSSVTFDYSVAGNDWTISGYVKNIQINPGTGKYETIDSVRLEEVWRRL